MADVARTRANAALDRSRERRHRRRIQMRRISAQALLPPSEEEVKEDRPAAIPPPLPPRPAAEWRNVVPFAGAVAVAGRQRHMEDAVTIWPNLCSPMINRRLPVHYFAVFDGHGGSHFSLMCKRKMHKIVKEELMGVAAGETEIGAGCPRGRPAPPPPELITNESDLQETWRILMNRVFARSEMVALWTCGCGSEGFRCSCERKSVSYEGTTAVAVVVTEKHFVVANCGDSRAVLYRSGRIIPLTFDHKPGRADEKARIEASGGRVMHTDTARVQGVLAMSRAIGDVFLKPYVISEPEVSFTRREEDDEFVIISSDGMWDVISSEMAGRVAGNCLREQENQGFSSRSSSAASLLTRLALARGTVDNISVIVVDLTRDAAAAA
ncbi:hypothetical protein C2S51_032686 [Perilla frutescens var. frutescens]|nr:hypothetical protein C2S51_032686 [Perilla frutescens var. frutescens]